MRSVMLVLVVVIGNAAITHANERGRAPGPVPGQLGLDRTARLATDAAYRYTTQAGYTGPVWTESTARRPAPAHSSLDSKPTWKGTKQQLEAMRRKADEIRQAHPTRIKLW